MHAILVTSSTAGALAALAPDRAVASLPVCGKSLLAHALDDLAMAGIETVDVYAAGVQASVADEFGDGRRWGMRLRHLDSLMQVDHELCTEGILVVDADTLRRPLLCEVLPQVRACADRPAEVYCGGEPAGLSFWPAGTVPAEVEVARCASARRIDVTGEPALRITTATALLAAQRMALDGSLPGLLFEAREVGAGCWLGVGARATASSLHGTRIFVGARSWIEPSVEVSDNVTLGANVVIDRGARLADCMVLDSTYVGESVDLRHAVVGGGYLVRTDTGAVIRIEDRFLLASLGRKRTRGLTGRIRTQLARLLPNTKMPPSRTCSQAASMC